MTSRSRLGKGLGALFPALPGEDDESNADKNRQQANKVSNSGNKQPTLQGLGAESDKRQRPRTDTAENDRASKEYSTTHSDRGSSQIAASAKSSESGRKRSKTGQKLVSSSESLNMDVSRETSTAKRATKRRSIPSISSLEHPSDLFFGPTTTDVSRETSLMVESNEVVDRRTKETQRSANRTPIVGNDTGSNNKPEGNHQEELKPVQGGYLAEVRVDDIRPNAQQPRQIFDEDELLELSRSIKEVGVLQPIVVRRSTLVDRPGTIEDKTTAVGNEANKSSAVETKTGDDQSSQLSKNWEAALRQGTHFEIIMGERRWRATRLAGLDTIPAIVKTTSDDTMLRDALLENLHRVALNPLEEAAAYQQMIDDFGLTQDGLSKSISKSRPQITNTLRLLKLPPSVQKKVSSGVLSAGHARALLTLPDEKSMTALADKIIAEGLSVRSTEELVALQTGQAKKRAKKPRVDAWADSPVRQDLESRFDTKVAIKGTKKHGKIEIVFSSPEDMDRIVAILLEKNQPASNDGDSGDKGWV
ncbi:chromosome partitioning protein ParB [Bifidobacterium asteroides]|nr:ParB/RepB/Spo0J family partition protein [Bifidobacterium asteroides]PXY86428.1 chromosome partitioning protein ParB [Bifidobacterium asteroides]